MDAFSKQKVQSQQYLATKVPDETGWGICMIAYLKQKIYLLKLFNYPHSFDLLPTSNFDDSIRNTKNKEEMKKKMEISREMQILNLVSLSIKLYTQLH